MNLVLRWSAAVYTCAVYMFDVFSHSGGNWNKKRVYRADLAALGRSLCTIDR